jgi:serine/threonine-protein kinase
MSRYVLEKRIGDGGMAEVFRARVEGPAGFQRVCAVKRLLPELRRDAGLQARFIDEARISGRLRHPNIVDVFDFYEEGGIHHLVMELVDGPSAEELLERAAGGAFLPLPVAGAIVIETARALEHAHGQGVLHRDVSPCNILVAVSGVIKLADFGLADAVGRLSSTEPGSVAGKLLYMSESRRRGAPATSEDDIHALGVVLRRMLDAVDPRERSGMAGRRWMEVQKRLVSGASGGWGDLPGMVRRLETARTEEVAAHVGRVMAVSDRGAGPGSSVLLDDPTLPPVTRRRR